MSELLDKILAGKAKTRLELAELPWAQKLALVKKMNERSMMIAKSPLGMRSRAIKPAVVATVVVNDGGGRPLSTEPHTMGLTPPARYQFPSQQNIRQNSITVIAGLK